MTPGQFKKKVNQGIKTFGLRAMELQHKFVLEHPSTQLPEGLSWKQTHEIYLETILEYKASHKNPPNVSDNWGIIL